MSVGQNIPLGTCFVSSLADATHSKQLQFKFPFEPVFVSAAQISSSVCLELTAEQSRTTCVASAIAAPRGNTKGCGIDTFHITECRERKCDTGMSASLSAQVAGKFLRRCLPCG